jgi:outer membrane protein TolC
MRERGAQEEAATIALTQARDRVAVDIERAYRAVERAQRGTAVARAASEAQRASLAIIRDQRERGLSTTAELAAAEANVAASDARVVAAELQVRVARAGLARATGG